MEYKNLPSRTAKSALVGREAGLEFLGERLEECLAGEGGMVVLSGEAGMGKTRLIDAVGEEAALRHLQCWRSAAAPGRAELAGGLFIGILRSLLWSGPQRQRQAMRKAVAELAPHLQGALDLPARRGRRTDAGDLPSEWQLKLSCARLAHHLREQAQSAPLVLCLEDLHWADLESGRNAKPGRAALVGTRGNKGGSGQDHAAVGQGALRQG